MKQAQGSRIVANSNEHELLKLLGLRIKLADAEDAVAEDAEVADSEEVAIKT